MASSSQCLTRESSGVVAESLTPILHTGLWVTEPPAMDWSGKLIPVSHKGEQWHSGRVANPDTPHRTVGYGETPAMDWSGKLIPLSHKGE
jgi:hypothetical protein